MRRRILAPLVVATALASTLVGCGGGSAPGSQDGDGDQFEADPWLVDDVETDAALASGVFEGVPLAGFSCYPEYMSTYGLGMDPEHTASAYYGPDNSGITWIADGQISSLSSGGVTPTVPGSVTISGEGYHAIGDGGSNDPWSASVQLDLRSVPAPDGDGCNAADAWVLDLIEAGTPVDEIYRDLTEVGLDVADDDCQKTYGYFWLPPTKTCEEYAVYSGDAEDPGDGGDSSDG